MTEKEKKEKLMLFRKDINARILREDYRRVSYQEIYKKSRSEDTHSSFLAWLLKGDDLPNHEGDTVINWFLDILIRRARQQEDRDPSTNQIIEKFPSQLEDAINCGDLNIMVEDVKREDAITRTERADIVVTCKLEKNVCSKKNLYIIIENKVTSEENKDKSGIYQTKRYYQDYMRKYSNDGIVLFVYLTPALSKDLNVWPYSSTCADRHFIHINYQDILDEILVSVLNIPNISERIEMFIKEYIDALYIPASEMNKNKRIIMAISQEKINLANEVWKNHKELFIEAYEAKKRHIWKENARPYDDIMIAFWDSQKDFFASLFEAINKYHANPNERTDALKCLCRCSDEKPKCFLNGDYSDPKQIADSAVQFAKALLQYCNNQGVQVTNIIQYVRTSFPLLPATIFNANSKSTQAINYGGSVLKFDKNCWDVNKGKGNFYKLMSIANDPMTPFKFIIEKA